jgi:hypothetical protein
MSKPSHAGKRFIVLQPSDMQNVDCDVWINGEKITPGELDDPTKQLFKHPCKTNFNGSIHVKIKVNSGRIYMEHKDAFGVYPCVYDNDSFGDKVEGLVAFQQHYYVQWMVNPSKEFNKNTLPSIESGETFEYDHLIPNGPEWIDVFFNKESMRKKFYEDRFIGTSLAEKCMFRTNSEYFIIDDDVDLQTRTINLIKQIGE